jgi:predicted DCC family thiol-disulfide oxidoreductase YuxK
LIFDGECDFCRRWIDRWRARLGEHLDFAPSQEVGSRYPQIPPTAFEESVVLVQPDGQFIVGARAVIEALAVGPGGGLPRRIYHAVPGARPVIEACYAWVAAHRQAASRITRWLIAPEPLYLMRRLFLAGLGVVYLATFSSQWIQMEGLVGSAGILPFAGQLERFEAALGWAAYWRIPTLFWVDSSDVTLNAACLAGVALSIAAIVGFMPRLVFGILWLLQLSLVSVGGVFLGYQWESLLLEAGFLAIWFAPTSRRGRTFWSAQVSHTTLWLLRYLLFRLMFFGGLRKLTSGDETWWSLRALDYHFYTQPLPTWTSYFAHHLPTSLHTFGVAMTLLLEIALPALVFFPRRGRQLACAGILVLQLAIAATGNYGFFNFLSICLCVTLLDDDILARMLPRRLVAAGARRIESDKLPLGVARRLVVGVVAVTLVVMSCFSIPSLAQFRLVGSYGLFAVMTTERNEIEIEGSADGQTWHPYILHWKPGPVDRRPEFAGLHMPRLDWQMWFASLRGCQRAYWFHSLLKRMLEGSEPVLRLFATNPFPGAPPRFVRSTFYRYEFSDPGSADWWVRDVLGPFCPTVTLIDGRLQTILPAPDSARL